jgi:serine/threonine protein kinase
MIWATGQLLQSGRYQVIKQIGRGGFGLTYLAEDKDLPRQVVLKAPSQTFLQEQDYEEFVRRFRREGQVLAKINHANIVRVIDLVQEARVPCLVMEYVEGETLKQCIERINYLPEVDAVRYFRQLAIALDTVHQVGLIHCDIHPGNVILRAGKEPILIDFGSTKSLIPTTYELTTTIHPIFSPYEQGTCEPQATLDIYALAATLYRAVTGKDPEPAYTRKVNDTSLTHPQGHRPELSDWLNQAILTGMALEPANRPSSMSEWLDLLQAPKVIPPKVTQVARPMVPIRPVELRRPPLAAPKTVQFEPPILTEVKPLQPQVAIRSAQVRVSSPQKQRSPISSRDYFPEEIILLIPLCCFLLMNLPVGIMIGLSNLSLEAGNWFWFWIGSGILTLAAVLPLVFGVETLTASMWCLFFGSVTLAVAVQSQASDMFLYGLFAWIPGVLGSWIGLVFGRKGAIVLFIAGSLMATVDRRFGAIAGLFVIIQVFMPIFAGFITKEYFEEYSRPEPLNDGIKLIYFCCIFPASFLGLVFGNIVGQWLQLYGVHLPKI